MQEIQAQQSESHISVRKIYKAFGNKVILNNIDLEIFRGEVLLIIGKSGTGKSVILKNMSGLMEPDSGSIFVDGEPFTGIEPLEKDRIRKKIGILFQGAALFDSLNVYDNIAFGMRRQNVPEDDISHIVSNLLHEMNLAGLEHKMPSDLSGGMQKRVGLARSLAIKPDIMLYDEPTTGVDPITGAAVDRMIHSMNRTHGITSIVITHDIKSISRIADRVAMLHEGTVRFLGTPDELLNSDDPFIQSFLEGRSDERH